MKLKFLSILAAVSVMFGAISAATAGTMKSADSADKPVSQVSDVQNMADDATVYIQGYLVQNLGNEMYMFQDDSGTIAIEIDDDLLASNTVAPNALVWIVAEVNKDGQVTSLEAEEIQFLPSQATNSTTNSNNK
ncbi:MAG: NirD/YgiW/YdeI family stress tolerance protein [Alphaproteobacteria bacterium]|nr:NirD/YgiW/YdeI family stress tolerance protein [Alphaproteobacteria bacterium]